MQLIQPLLHLLCFCRLLAQSLVFGSENKAPADNKDNKINETNNNTNTNTDNNNNNNITSEENMNNDPLNDSNLSLTDL